MAKFPSKTERERRKVPRFPYRLDVQVVWKGEREDCVTADISLYGAFVVNQNPAPLDSIVRLRVIRGLEDPIEWMGKVARVVYPRRATAEEPAGMALEIFGVSERDWDRWVWVIAEAAQKCEAKYGPEQERSHGDDAITKPRRFVRVPTQIEVAVQGMPALLRLVARDISAGGMFIRCKEVREPGTEVELLLRHPMSKEKFELAARVVRVEKEGMAVEFLGLDPERRRQLQRFIVTGRRPGS